MDGNKKNMELKNISLNDEMIDRIQQEGCDLNRVLIELDKNAEGLPERVNYIGEVYTHHTGAVEFELYHKTDDNNYNYLKRAAIDGALLPPLDQIKNIFNAKTIKNTLGRERKAVNGYSFKALNSNKPGVLKSAINGDFVCFFAVNNNGVITKSFTMDKGGDTLPFELVYKLNYSYNKRAAAETRKEAASVIAVYNCNFCKPAEKHESRRNKPLMVHYRYKAQDLDWWGKRLLSVSFYQSGECVVEGFSVGQLANKCIYDPKATEAQRADAHKKEIEEIFKKVCDKSGFFILEYRHDLKTRFAAFKKQKEKERLVNYDKSELLKHIASTKNNAIELLKLLSNYEYIKTPNATKNINNIKEFIEKIEALKERIGSNDYYSSVERMMEDVKTLMDQYKIILTLSTITDGKIDNFDNYRIEGNNCVYKYEWGANYNYLMRFPVFEAMRG